MRWLGSITNATDMNLSKLQETVKDREPGALQSMRSKESDTTERLKGKNNNK